MPASRLHNTNPKQPRHDFDEVALQDRTGILAAPNNPQRLKEAIQNLSWDKNKRSALTSEAIRLLKNEFSWDAHLRALSQWI